MLQTFWLSQWLSCIQFGHRNIPWKIRPAHSSTELQLVHWHSFVRLWLPIHQPSILHSHISTVCKERPPPFLGPQVDAILCNWSMRSVPPIWQLYLDIRCGCRIVIFYLSAYDHLCAWPKGAVSWQFEATVTTLLSFHRCLSIELRWRCCFCRANNGMFLLHLFFILSGAGNGRFSTRFWRTVSVAPMPWSRNLFNNRKLVEKLSKYIW